MKTKIIIPLVMGVMCFLVPLSQAQNVLIDGSFDTTTEIVSYSEGIPTPFVWNSFKNAGVEANASVVNGVFEYQVNFGGFELWEVQLEQTGFPLIPGNYYRLTYEARADAERPYGLYLGEYGGSWTSLIGYENYWQYATPQWQTLSYDFQAWSVFENHKLSFEIGGVNGNMYFDNILLEDLGPFAPIGIIGSSINGWDVDVDMITSDGIIYTLSNFPLTTGFVKFRQNNNWNLNWGGDTFPTGIAYPWGPEIPIISGSIYDIIFNRETGEYSFTCVSNCHVGIEIAGTAVNQDINGENKMNMWTNDGITYTLKSQWFVDGEAKFRQSDNWEATWGDAAFPTGIATEGGNAILVKAGNYNVTFNIQTGAYSFSFPEIGILGSALAGWTEDIEMQTTDGEFYTLMNYDFTEGEVKFRQDKDWEMNWGGYSFPTGFGWQNGPNIPVLAGNYNVTFNRISGEYFFQATTCPDPRIQCHETIYWSNSPGMCGAEVYYPDVAAPNCGGEGISIVQTVGLPSGSFFPIGTTTNTFLLTNSSGLTSTCSFDIIVYDYEPPLMEDLSANVESLWAPNHKMIPVTINYTVTDNCEGPTYSQLWVYSNEPENGIGAGKIGPDFEVLDEHHLLLRAERSGRGNGRGYYILIESRDESWNYSYQIVVVTIPHDMKGLAGRSLTLQVLNSTNVKLPLKSAQIESIAESMPVEVKVWPNPSAHYFNLEIQTSSDESIEISLSDINGRLISNLGVMNQRFTQFGDDLKPGIYILRIRQGASITTCKVVKQ